MTPTGGFRQWIPRRLVADLFVLIVLGNVGVVLLHAYAQNSLPYVEQVPVPKNAQAIEDGRALLQALVESSKVSALSVRPDRISLRSSMRRPFCRGTTKALRAWKPSRPPS
jgi:hypothetical protein